MSFYYQNKFVKQKQLLKIIIEVVFSHLLIEN
jgi:hypothetical protein